MFLTPLFEVKKAEKDRFVSLAYDKDNNPTVYKYLDGKEQIKTVNIPLKSFERLTLATFENGSIMYADINGNIGVVDTPQGL